MVQRSVFTRHSYLWCCRRYGTRPYQYVAFDFYRLKSRSRKRYACDTGTNQICRKAKIFRNQEENIFANKKLFNQYFQEQLGREFIDETASDTEIREFLRRHDKIMIKAPNGHSGEGIRKVRAADLDPEKLITEIRCDKLLLDEAIEQCDEMAWLNESSINTLRIVTIRDKFGKVHVIGGCVRIGRKGVAIDNVENNTMGGYCFPLNIELGYVCGKGVNLQCTRYSAHPDSGKLIVGFQIPRFQEVLDFCIKAMDVVPKQRVVGWDVCIGKDRLYMIEGNTGPGSITFEPGTCGKKAQLHQAIE